jgi:hypothetical protein
MQNYFAHDEEYKVSILLLSFLPYCFHLHDSLEKINLAGTEVPAAGAGPQFFQFLIYLSILRFKILIYSEVIHQFEPRLMIVIAVQ